MIGVTLVPIRPVGSMFSFRSWSGLRRRGREAEKAKSPNYSDDSIYFMIIVWIAGQRGPNHLIIIVIVCFSVSCVERIHSGNAGVEAVPCV